MIWSGWASAVVSIASGPAGEASGDYRAASVGSKACDFAGYVVRLRAFLTAISIGPARSPVLGGMTDSARSSIGLAFKNGSLHRRSDGNGAVHGHRSAMF